MCCVARSCEGMRCGCGCDGELVQCQISSGSQEKCEDSKNHAVWKRWPDTKSFYRQAVENIVIMSRLFHRSLLWGDFLEILSFLTINDVYRCCGTLNRAGFVAFLRERATRQCPKESASKSRFLSSGLNHQKILLVSYPRSGNSYLRRLLESSFGIVTGSDSRPNRTLSESLLKCGFKGRA